MTLTAPGALQADPGAGAPTPPNPARGLICRNCGATFGLIAEHACAECFGPLEVDYDKDLLTSVTREQIEAGPQNIWRYAALLPVGQDPAERVSLDPGMTPLIRADRRPVGQGRLGQPDALVQGPRGQPRRHRGARARLPLDRLRLHRQPGQLRR